MTFSVHLNVDNDAKFCVTSRLAVNRHHSCIGTLTENLAKLQVFIVIIPVFIIIIPVIIIADVYMHFILISNIN